MTSKEVAIIKVANYVYCENIRDENGKLVLFNPFTMICPIAVPTNYTFYFSVGIHDIPLDGDTTLFFSFVSPKGEKLIDESFNLPPVSSEMIKGGKAGIQINIALQNVVLKTAGKYVMNLSTNSNDLGKYPIEVIPNNDD